MRNLKQKKYSNILCKKRWIFENKCGIVLCCREVIIVAKRRPSGEGMIRQKKKGQWEGRIVVGQKENGDPIFRYVYAKTQKELIDKLHHKIDEFLDAELTENSNMTLGEWLDKWIDEYMTGTI